MKKNLLKILLVLLISVAIILYASNVNAANLQATIEIVPDKLEAPIGGNIVFSFKIKDILNASDNMVTAAEAKISYDGNFFEFVTEDDIQGMDINTKTGKIIADFKAKSGNTTEIGSIKLKIKDTANGSGTVTFSNLSASDGEAIATTADKTFTINIAKTNSENTSNSNSSDNNNSDSNSGSTDNSGNSKSSSNNNSLIGNNSDKSSSSNSNTSKSSTNSKQTNTTSSKSASTTSNQNNVKKLPKTGTTSLISSIAIFIVIAIISYRKYLEHKKI